MQFLIDQTFKSSSENKATSSAQIKMVWLQHTSIYLFFNACMPLNFDRTMDLAPDVFFTSAVDLFSLDLP